MTYADTLDHVGKNSRQRKVRRIWQEVREHDVITSTTLTGLGYTVEKLGMPIGDYGWEIRDESWLATAGYATMCVERKSLADLRDVPRLKRQLSKMRLTWETQPTDLRTLFVVMTEYKFDTDRKRKWPEESILNADLSIQLGGVVTTRCEGNDVAGRLHSLYKYSQKKTHQLAGGD